MPDRHLAWPHYICSTTPTPRTVWPHQRHHPTPSLDSLSLAAHTCHDVVALQSCMGKSLPLRSSPTLPSVHPTPAGPLSGGMARCLATSCLKCQQCLMWLALSVDSWSFIFGTSVMPLPLSLAGRPHQMLPGILSSNELAAAVTATMVVHPLCTCSAFVWTGRLDALTIVEL